MAIREAPPTVPPQKLAQSNYNPLETQTWAF
jgi:hypothetical protein